MVQTGLPGFCRGVQTYCCALNKRGPICLFPFRCQNFVALPVYVILLCRPYCSFPPVLCFCLLVTPFCLCLPLLPPSVSVSLSLCYPPLSLPTARLCAFVSLCHTAVPAVLFFPPFSASVCLFTSVTPFCLCLSSLCYPLLSLSVSLCYSLLSLSLSVSLLPPSVSTYRQTLCL